MASGSTGKPWSSPAAPAASAAPCEDDAAAVCCHVFYSGEYAVIKAFYIHFEHAVEILPGCCFELADAGDAAIVPRGVDSATLGQQLKRGW